MPQLTYGSVVVLRNKAASGGFLDAHGDVRATPDFTSLDEIRFALTREDPVRGGAGSRWRIVSADGRKEGETVGSGDYVYLQSVADGAGYLDSCMWVKDLAPFMTPSTSYAGAVTCGVFTNASPKRQNGATGRWRIGGVDLTLGTPLTVGGAVTLENGYPGAGFLVGHGAVGDVPAFKQEAEYQAFAFTSADATTQRRSGTWSVETAPDLANMVPLRAATYVKNEFVATVSGKAISGGKGYEVHFDTGSWTLAVPEACLDPKGITVLDENAADALERPAKRVKGQIGLTAADGKTVHAIDDYEFFATKSVSAAVGERYNSALMGGFPSASSPKPLPYALAEKLAKDGKITGFGIVSYGERSYLFFGPDPAAVDDRMRWRTDTSPWKPSEVFSPEAVPGFAVTLAWPDGKQVSVPGLMATLDTGAPQMVLRLNDKDPQTGDLAAHFTTAGYWTSWKNADYDAAARQVVGPCTVTVTFTDSAGTASSYSFTADDDRNKVAVGTWNGNVPWPVGEPAKPRTRFNVGDTVFRLTSAVYFDIANKRVGIRFR